MGEMRELGNTQILFFTQFHTLDSSYTEESSNVVIKLEQFGLSSLDSQ